jgi:hypothetical protein
MLSSLVRHPVFPYATPFALFMAVLAINSRFKDAVYVTYPLMVFMVGLAIAYLWNRMPPFKTVRPAGSIALGLIGAALWIGLYPYLGRTNPDPAAGFNPRIFESPEIQWGLIAFRMAGFVLIVPIMEEVFWRGFLQRFLIKDDFETVGLGAYSHFSFWGTTAMFVLAHADQWGVALLWGAMAGAWFVRTKGLGDIILLHATTNLALGIYVVATQKWYFW